jgi:hypothetical protein
MNHSTSPHCYLTHIVIVRTKVGPNAFTVPV